MPTIQNQKEITLDLDPEFERKLQEAIEEHAGSGYIKWTPEMDYYIKTYAPKMPLKHFAAMFKAKFGLGAPSTIKLRLEKLTCPTEAK